ncbi:MAG: glycosyltransferase family 2 protein [Hyphomicrobiales bacterium]|nr:glycosyltransferase family 2 protein [Rhodoblastus sp.]MCC0001056.1 glycosyltransferase family 2 protein [Methylobacteriaceae bacterium]MCC2101577.1 glycosyltransferase family 2 protein [Hyphomicrobiales bacterium]HRY01674.1 glycosyltransferase family 2 protein [Beijerinckiaceae bacterium]MCB1522598.1 glycosyltransferase family 2 protein [Rhodoblastus sp.]
METVSIVIPTLNRQTCLQRALASVRAQQAEGVEIEIIVVDNSSDASARATVAAFGVDGLRILYLSEPAPGVATARNAGVRAAQGRWIAFLDDDEEARTDWIAEMLRVALDTGAQAVFGPVEARADDAAEIGGFAPYFSRAIDRPDGDDITELSAYLGTNNSMFERALCLSDGAPFEESLNEIGGEDSLLLERLAMRGFRFAWAARAGVIEWVPQRRLDWAYVCKRKFLSGQIRVFVQDMAAPGRGWRIAFWMVAGLVQFVVAGALAVLFRPFDRARAQRASATAYGGLGKVLWTPRFRPTLYGSGLIS